MDSLFPNHPGLPQNHALFEHNLIHSNNSNYYGYVTDGTCARPFLLQGLEKGVVCPAVQVPVGTGILVIGGNYNVFRDNWIYDNWKIGIVQTWVPGVARNDTRWSAQGETSHNNRYLANHMGTSATGQRLPNGLDYFWDGEGTGNCWETAATDVVQPLTASALPGGRASARDQRPQLAGPLCRLLELRPLDQNAAGRMRLVHLTAASGQPRRHAQHREPRPGRATRRGAVAVHLVGAQKRETKALWPWWRRRRPALARRSL